MPMEELYAYLLEKKLMTPLFTKPRDSPFPPGFDPSKKCEHHFRAERRTLEECVHLRHQIQDFINNKLIQFDNMAGPNALSFASSSRRECECYLYSGRKDSRFSHPFHSFWKAMLWALAQESHIILENIGTLGFD